MSDALLPYYDRELTALRKLAVEFAESHPKIAGRLRMAADGVVDDPHVERLLEGVAFLGARVQHRLDDEFPELTDALLGVLYPHYLPPTPSTAIVQFVPQAELLTPVRLAPGLLLDTEPVRGEPCRFRTAYAVTLWPLEIEAVRLSGLPLAAPANPLAAGAAAVLRITLRCTSPEATFRQLGVDQLRFFIRAAGNVALPLYELLCAHVLSIALAESAADAAPVILAADSLTPAGFAPEEALLPWPARSFSGFRLLGEYFAAPEKFLFVDLARLDAKTMVGGGNRLEIFIYLDRAAPDLERAISAESLALGCTPAANLFPQRCEPIALTHTDIEYRVVADVRRPSATEIWGVERVREAQSDGGTRPWRPFYRLAAGDPEAERPGGFYALTRRPSPSPLTGTELFLAPYDTGFNVDRPADTVLSVDALCCNRDLPADLQWGGGHPRMRPVEGLATVAAVNCLTAPTATLRRPLRENGYWRLVSHLALGHLSVSGGKEAASVLREVLRLYDLRETAESRAAIEALLSVSAAPGVSRVPGARVGAFCRGLDLTFEFDARAWQAGGLYLLAAVLDRFVGLHGSINSFTRSSAVLRGRPGVAAAWPARAGARVLL